MHRLRVHNQITERNSPPTGYMVQSLREETHTQLQMRARNKVIVNMVNAQRTFVFDGLPPMVIHPMFLAFRTSEIASSQAIWGLL